MKSLVFVALIFIVGETAFGKVRSPTDSLKQLVSSRHGDERSKLLIQLSYQYAGNNPDTALVLLEQALAGAKTPEIRGKVLFERAMLHRFLENDKRQAEALDSAYQTLKGVNDSIAANALHYKVVLLQLQGQYEKALQTGHLLIDTRKALPSRNHELNAVLQTGYTYDRMGDYRKAIVWYKKGLEIQGVTNENFIGRAYGLIGIAYDGLAEYEEAIAYNLQAVEHFKKAPNSSFLHTWYSNLGNTYTKMGKLDLAEKYTLLALEDAKEQRYIARVNLGKIYMEQGLLAESQAVLEKVTQELENTGQTNYLSQAYNRMHELYRKKGDYKTALAYFEKYKANEDKRLSEAKIKQVNELAVEYETAEKERLLAEQRAQLAEGELLVKNRNQWIFGLSFLAIGLAAIGTLLYKQEQLKSQQVQREAALKLTLNDIEHRNRLQEQRLAISRDLHDNIGSQLTFIISAIDTLKQFVGDQNTRFTERLAHMGAFAKDTIQELRDTIWAMNKDQIALEDLETRVSDFIEKANLVAGEVGLVFRTDVEGDTIIFDSRTGMWLYRILQEAVNNAIKYAEAKTIAVTFGRDAGLFLLTVEDDGKGFDVERAERGNGLENMRRRAQVLHGELELVSEKGKTVVSCRIPIKHQKDEEIA
ncbi:tetratricopeptide repeat protein [Parapedobacter sp. 2B3]|uniref:tetratricopeptide repeat-containing sensor histidine kinase n=1 Tax=Parapedobacter sp. 2B3 TaxID=3342381 RepID=UPI0035B6340D